MKGETKLDVASVMLPLFVPADRPERFIKAAAAAPDAIIIDLEDAVAPPMKEEARAHLAGNLVCARLGVPLLLRVNAIETPWHAADLDIAAELPLAAIMLPKSESAAMIAQVHERTNLPVVALIETARGLAAVDQIAQQCERIAFGSIDFALDLAMEHTRTSLQLARSAIVQASRVAGLPAPWDGVTTAIDDTALLQSDCLHAVEMGFGGKLLIHPKQIDPARRAFAPSPEQIEWAHRVFAAASSQHGAVQLDGVMIDAPLVAQARRILARAGVEK